jgi:two-component system sensor histidine kinase KdpD
MDPPDGTFRQSTYGRPPQLSAAEVIAFLQHETANSLQRILGHTSFLRRLADQPGAAEIPEAWRTRLRHIELESVDLGRLVNVLPLLGSGCPVSLQPVLLQSLLPRVVLERWNGGDLRISLTELAEDLPAVLASPDLLRAVLHNLLSNAEKYAPESSSIDIGASRSWASVLLRVRDYGRGVDADELESVFDLSFRSESHSGSAPGTGVGLAVCRTLVDAMGGRITAQLPEGPGLQVTVELRTAA